MKYILSLFIVTALAITSGCGSDSGGDAPGENRLLLRAIQLTFENGNNPIPAGYVATLKALAIYSDGHTEDVTQLVEWRSENTGIAAFFSQTNQVEAKAAGTVTLSAQWRSLKSTIELTVTPATVTRVVIHAENYRLPKGLSQQYQASVGLSDGTSHNAAAHELVWSSSNNTVVMDENTGVASAQDVPEKGQLAANITATAHNGLVSEPLPLLVTAAQITDVDIQPKTLSTPSGLTSQYIAKATYTDGSQHIVNNQVTWKIVDDKVASINQHGLITAKQPGTTDITAELDGFSSNNQKASFNVSPAILDNIQIEDSISSLIDGNQYPFTARGFYSDGSDHLITGDASWVSTNLDAATVVSGVVVADLAEDKTADETTIIVTYDQKSDSQKLAITHAEITNLSLTWPAEGATNSVYTKTFLSKGAKVNLIATATLTNGNHVDITSNRQTVWGTEDFSQAIISVTGEATGTGAGDNPLYHTPGILTVGYQGLTAAVAFLGQNSIAMPNDATHLIFTGPITQPAANKAHVQYVASEGESPGIGPQGMEFIRQNYAQAQQFCDDLSYDGYDDWRLPTISELHAVRAHYETAEFSGSDPDFVIYKTFKWATGHYFWSSTPGALIEGEPSHKKTLLTYDQTFDEKDTSGYGAFTSCVRATTVL